MTSLRSRAAVCAATALAVLAAVLGIPSAQAAVTAGDPSFSPGPARAALARLLPRHVSQFRLVPVDRPASGDYFTVSGGAGSVRVEGTSPAVLLSGVNWYLKHTARVDIGWPGDSTARLPAILPAPAAPVRKDASVPHRFALNDTDDGYSGAYRGWAAYEKQLDLLALHGVNEVFVQMGADAVYYETFKEFGYSGRELRSWIPGPAHQPWWLMQNMAGFGGPVSERLLADRAELGRRIADRVRELGMTPVLPGYYGTVPPRFTEKNPAGRVVPQGDWVGFERPDWLDPRNTLYPEVAEAFYRHQRTLFGDSAMYKMDLLHEGGRPGDVPIGDAADAVMNALQTARPGATWVLLGWQNNPSTQIIDAVDKSRLLIVDGLSDRYNGLDRESAWHGAPYAFGTIPNFGGHTTIGANTAVWAERFDQWRSKPGSALKGIAYLPEGTGGNPVAYELFTELAWRTGPVDHRAWYAAYAERRYGGVDPHAAKAWELLRTGPYSTPSGTWSESQDSLFTARPRLTATTAAGWSPGHMRYDPATVQRALAELLQVAPALRGTDAYRYDLVDVARQAMANRSRTLLPQIKAAYDAKDLALFRRLAAEWQDDLALLDELLATDSRFLLGPWLKDATSWGTTDAERAAAEFDARSVLTTWGHRSGSDNGGLRDYANREWSGLVSGFYAKRWALYLDSLDTALATGRAPAAIDWFAWENAWNQQRDRYPVEPSGDPVAKAAEVQGALPAPAATGPVTDSGGRCVDVTGGSSADGTALQLYSCNGTPAQAWTVPGDGTLRAYGKCMDVRGGAVADGTVVQLYPCNGTPAQAWTPLPDRTLRNVKSGRCLHAEGGSADGAKLLIRACTAGAEQQWKLPG
ncbi:alpha-N-acetylglucosaminidase [Streptomyces sp. V4I23]|uniref:alpha-N-acetylglucosaminidase n=1 Tax=Streptomyces sp. V4I23 TaxID=3042282 RepID=UPI00277D8FD9|nr:alpha-N-acetylglucosaminidase [Streptomyces sp. V4I23]MDQ1006628.1 alpha-N-acetylglucosaminidase [Streptomyces sp. V4I23]